MEMFGSVHGSSGVAPGGPFLIPTQFVWPRGGTRVFLCGSFTGWSTIIPMSPVEGYPTVFQVICSLTPGLHQYKFNVDGGWRHDEQQPFVSGNFGVVNTILVRQPYILPPISSAGTHTRSLIEVDVDHNVSGHLEAYPRMSESDLHVSRYHIFIFLCTNTAYELLPESGKVIALDINLSVKEAFDILYEEGLSVVPVWDSSNCQFVGVLSAMDFIQILKELVYHGSNLTEEQLETHTIAAWREGKLRQCGTNSNGRTHPWRFIDAGPYECLKDVALKILQNKVAAVPIIHSSPEDGSVPQLLHMASLSEILKCICRHFKHCPGSLPILQLPIGSIPLGMWVSKVGESNKQPLAMLRPNAPLSAALSLLILAEVSSIPIVDDNGALLDIYSRSDITALVKNKAYARISLDDFSIYQKIPKWWVWCYWICPTAWSLNGLLTSQYGDMEKEILIFGDRKSVGSFLRDYYGFRHDRLSLVAVVLIAYPIVYASLLAYCIGKMNYQKR